MNVTSPKPERRPPGRPRRLDISQIVDAAVEIGLEDLSLSAVARRLGVGMTVLYGYVANREELVRLVAARLVQGDFQPTDSGQHWATYVVEAAAALHSTLTGPGKLIAHFLTGGLGAEVEIDRTEAWLNKLTAAGFTVRDALLVSRRMGEIVIGAAVIQLHVNALDQAGHPFEQAALKVLAARGEEVPLLASERALFAARVPVWQESIVQLIERLAEDRGETVDRRALQDAFGQFRAQGAVRQ